MCGRRPRQVSRLHAAALAATCALAAHSALVGCHGQDPAATRATAEATDSPAPPQPSATPTDATEAPAGPTRRPAETEARQPEPPTKKALSDYQRAMIDADAALYAGRFDAARNQYLHALELRPKKMSPALGALRTMVLDGHGEERAVMRRRIRQKVDAYLSNPDHAGAGYLLSARLAIALQRPGEALDKARLAIEKLPELGVAWRILGEAAMVAERWGKAVEAFQRAATLGLAAKAGTWERMADALDELGEVAGAERAARKALELTGSDPHARRRRLSLLAVILKHRGDLDEAQATLETARELGPEDASVLHNLATIAEARGRGEDALVLYAAAIEAGEPMPMTSWRRGHLLLRLDRRREALESFTAAAAHIDRWTWPRSTRWRPAYDIGRIYAGAGHEKEAVGWFEDALRLARTTDAIRSVRSWLSWSRVRASGAK